MITNFPLRTDVPDPAAKALAPRIDVAHLRLGRGHRDGEAYHREGKLGRETKSRLRDTKAYRPNVLGGQRSPATIGGIMKRRDFLSMAATLGASLAWRSSFARGSKV